MANDPQVAVFYDRERSPGATSLGAFQMQPDIFLADAIVSLQEAMETVWEQDAHFSLYHLEDEDGDAAFARVNKRKSTFVPDLIKVGGGIKVPLLAFDYDRTDAAGDKERWTEEGLAEFVAVLGQSDLPNPTYFYTTKHGCRFVYVLTEPVDQSRAERLAAGIMRDFDAEGVELDESCQDWTRMFRLPQTRRASEQKGKEFYGTDFFMLVGPGELLDPDTITPGEAKWTKESFDLVEEYTGDRPDHDECEELLWTKGSRSRRKGTAWYSLAKKLLQGREAYAICFEDGMLDTSEGWDTALTKLIGQVVGMTAREEIATPEGIYALLLPALEQLEADDDDPDARDWLEDGWDKLCRMWTNEQSQIEAERQEYEQEQMLAAQAKADIVETYREGAPTDVPQDPEEAEEWLRRRMIATCGDIHRVMLKDGTYSINGVRHNVLVPTIKHLGMDNVINTQELRGRSVVDRPVQAILNDHCIPVNNVTYSSSAEVARISGEPGYYELLIPVHQLDPKLEPEYSEQVDEWLQALFGPMYEQGIMWLSHCLDVSRPICALNLYGASGAGKGMLAHGIAECFRVKRVSDDKVLGRFNIGLVESPVVWFDEGVPSTNMPGCNTTDQTFRKLVSGGSLGVEGKNKDVMTAQVYPRLLISSNNQDVMRALVGHRDLSEDDIEAIEIRLMSVEVGQSAVRWLRSHGNYSTTRGWIAGDGPSRYTLAKHIMWLYDNRKPYTHGTGRLLVEGEKGSEEIQTMTFSTTTADVVLRTLFKMIEDPSVPSGMHILRQDENDAGVFVIPSGVLRYYERHLQDTMRKYLTDRNIAKVLRNLSTDDSPSSARRLRGQNPDEPKQKWYELRLDKLLEQSVSRGELRRRQLQKLAEAALTEEQFNAILDQK